MALQLLKLLIVIVYYNGGVKCVTAKDQNFKIPHTNFLRVLLGNALVFETCKERIRLKEFVAADFTDD